VAWCVCVCVCVCVWCVCISVIVVLLQKCMKLYNKTPHMITSPSELRVVYKTVEGSRICAVPYSTEFLRHIIFVVFADSFQTTKIKPTI